MQYGLRHTANGGLHAHRERRRTSYLARPGTVGGTSTAFKDLQAQITTVPGLIHPAGGLEGPVHVAGGMPSHAGPFGMATECGFGR